MARGSVPTALLVGVSALFVLALLPDRDRLARVEPIDPAAPLAATHPVSDDDVRDAIARALPELEAEGVAWFEGRVPIQGGSPCVSCHHVGFTLWSHYEAARRGVPIPRDRIDALASDALEFLARPRTPRIVSTSQMLLAMRPEHHRIAHDADWRTLIEHLGEAQRDDGSWRARGQFPDQRRDEDESDAAMTLWAMLAIEDAGIDALEQAKTWRDGTTERRSTEWIAARSIVDRDRPDGARRWRELVLLRNPDGGWPWSAGEPSNAFSTGQALYALAHAPDDAERDEAIAAGRAWLVAAQLGDGRWQTPSELISAHPSEERDVIYDYWGTAWAAIGLARTLPSGGS